MSGLARLVTALCFVMLLGTPAFAAEELTVEELNSRSVELTGVEVEVVGELVGDYGQRDDGWTWSQLNGDVYTRRPLHEDGAPAGGNTGIGLRMPSELTVVLDVPGGYRNRGPLVRVVGIWRHHSPERQGESFLEATSVEVVEPGRRFDHGTNWWAIGGGIALLAAAGAVWVTRPSD